ncbi:MAG: hypothetical protein ACOVP4_01220 [Bacteriovoracaceae bacterium]
MKILNLALAFLMLLSTQAFAQNSSEDDNVAEAIGEIFVKGSIDGKSLFMVYGFNDAIRDIKGLAKNSVKMDDLVDIGQAVYDDGHDEDYIGAVKEGTKATGEMAKATGKSAQNIAKYPWKSLKRMKKSYKVSFDNAKDSYYHANSPVTGAAKYAGHAIWANVKGAYYLVVEVPVVTAVAIGATVVNGAATVLAVPATVVLQTLKLAWRVMKVGIRFAFNTASMAISGAYSVLSTTTAATVTVVAAGGLAIVKGLKWTVSLPGKIFNPIQISSLTDIAVDQQEEFAKKAEDILTTSLVLTEDLALIDSKISKYSSKFTLGRNGKSEVTIKLSVVKKKVKIAASATRKFMKSLRDAGESKKDARQDAKEVLETLIASLLK